jgi:hypothetical protein
MKDKYCVPISGFTEVGEADIGGGWEAKGERKCE